MEPISHAIVGAAVATLSGQPATWHNPIYLGAMLGAIGPDLDIVFQAFGDMAYLRQHRGFSHSILGVALLSIPVSFLVNSITGFGHLWQLFWWTYFGGLSHIFLDVLNSYGAQIFAPLSKKRLTLNLLQIFDPLLLLFMLGALVSTRISGSGWFTPQFNFWGAGLYLISRWMMRQVVYYRIFRHFNTGEIRRIVPMPSLFGITSWDFLIENSQRFIVGQIRLINCRVLVKRELERKQDDQIVEVALTTKVGQMFRDFTPYFHVSHSLLEGQHVIKIFDLRYLIKSEFMHSATIILDQQRHLVDSFFHPYHNKRNVKL